MDNDGLIEKKEGEATAVDLKSPSEPIRSESVASSSSEERLPISRHCRRFEVFVIGFDGDNAIVTSNLPYPGVDSIVHMKGEKLEFGEFLEIYLDVATFDKYFPWTHSPEVEQFKTDHFKKIKTPTNYSVEMVDDVVRVWMKKVIVSINHRKGENIEDSFLGTVEDPSSLVPKGPKTVCIIAERQPIRTSLYGKPTVWKVIDVREAIIEETNEDAREKPKKKKNTKDLVQRLGGVIFNPILHGVPRPIVPTEADNQAMEKKQAFITKVFNMSGCRFAHVWLTDVHRQAHYILKDNETYQPGHFFEGLFFYRKLNKKKWKWVCQEYVSPLEPLIPGVMKKGSLDMEVTVNDYFPECKDHDYPETFHPLLGRITDLNYYMPIGGKKDLKITTRLIRNGSGRLFWFVLSCN